MNYPAYTIQIRRHEAPFMPDGIDEEGEPKYKPWDDGLLRHYWRCSVDMKKSKEAEHMFASFETPAFLPDKESESLATLLSGVSEQIEAA